MSLWARCRGIFYLNTKTMIATIMAIITSVARIGIIHIAVTKASTNNIYTAAISVVINAMYPSTHIKRLNTPIFVNRWQNGQRSFKPLYVSLHFLHLRSFIVSSPFYIAPFILAAVSSFSSVIASIRPKIIPCCCSDKSRNNFIKFVSVSDSSERHNPFLSLLRPAR